MDSLRNFVQEYLGNNNDISLQRDIFATDNPEQSLLKQIELIRGDIYRYFRTNYTGHSSTNAYLLSLLSLFIYKGLPPGNGTFAENFKAQFQNLSASSPFEIRQLDSNMTPGFHNVVLDTQAAVLSNSVMTLIVFRGSEKPVLNQDEFENIRDWIVDIAGAVPELDWANDGLADHAFIHSGFKKSLDKIYDDLLACVNANSGQPVFLTGHSLGGALALLCAYKLRAVHNINVGGTYTFAAPRPGNGHFRYKYDNLLGDRTFCWEYKDDPVPHFPPTGLTPLSPSHVGQLNRVMSDNTIHMNDNQPYIPIPLQFDDHNMKNYVQVMEQRLVDNNRIHVNDPAYLLQTDVPDFG